MGWHGDRIRNGSNQWEWFGHGNPRGVCDKFNSDDHDEEDWVCRWLGTSHGDIACCCIETNVWNSSQNGKWFHGADREL